MEVPRFRKKNSLRYKRRYRRRCTLDYNNDRCWESGYLRAKCKELELEEEYQKYQVRLMNSYLGVFLLLHIAVIACYITQLLLLTEHTYRVYPDVGAFMITGVLMLCVLSVNFLEDFVMRHRWVRVLTSVLASLLLVSADLGLNAYHYTVHDWPIVATMDIYGLCIIYMFLPIPSTKAAALLAILVSVMYVFYYLNVVSFLSVYATRIAHTYDVFVLDIFHYFGFNVMGIFFRVMNDTMARASFLDRYQFMREENWQRRALHQEAMLLHTILPPQIASPYQESIRNKIMQADSGVEYGSLNHQSSMAVQIHPDVTILYADVVNYTHLTTTLSVENLVMVLHDLYGRFDMAAAKYRVQRIKFLGDCYYCVAGLVNSDPDHAKNAVSLGLAMIAYIEEVRVTWELDINMRIGIHSGSLFAGVIGRAKLQFDIWGADVDIANHLESTGKPGCVHISSRTLSNLTPSIYTILPGTVDALNDPVIQNPLHPLKTYLITGCQLAPDRLSVISRIEIRSQPEEKALTTDKPVIEEMRKEFSKMPVAGFEFRWCRRNDETPSKSRREIGLFCTVFNDETLEKNYLQQPNFFFNGSMLVAWLILVCLIFIQTMGHDGLCVLCIVGDMIVIIILTSLLFISWYKKLCWWKNGDNESIKYNKFSCRVFHISEKIQCSLFLRIICYLVTIACYYSAICLILGDCDHNKFMMEFIEGKIYHYEVKFTTCFHPWAFTNMMALVLGMSYSFAGVPFPLKTCIACLEAVIYLVILFLEYEFVFQHSNTSAPFLAPEIAHCDRILLMLVTLYVKERQVEFNVKTNYRLNVNLKEKQKVTIATNESIIILLNNILPAHVVDLYLYKLTQHELYYENYQMVSVMFAKLMNFKMDLPSLRVLNCIITEFDILLSSYKEYYLVEKIKVVGCTYMAACGLDFSKISRITRGRLTDLERTRTKRSVGTECETQDEVVYLMTTFALDLMRTLASCNKAYKSLPLDRMLSSTTIAIGISSGEIMAGVVGASQPHYDIWGNPVNMASRMQSTGLSSHIQVTEESAKILMDYGVLCLPRGLTFVKGRGAIPTFFVAIDDKLEFMSTDPPELNAAPSTHISAMSLVKAPVYLSSSSEEDEESYKQ